METKEQISLAQLKQYSDRMQSNMKRVVGDHSDSIIDWPELQDVLAEGEIGDAKIEHFNISGRYSFATSMSEKADIAFIRPGKYVKLVADGNLQMSDTRMERVSNTDFVINAWGDVLIAGLGIGMSLIPVISKPEVRTVTVVELNKNVINLVEPQIRKHLGVSKSKKLSIINADVFEWKPEKGKKWNAIWLDIWHSISSDYLPEIRRLKNKFKHRVDRTKSFFFKAWHEDLMRKMKKFEDMLESNPRKAMDYFKPFPF